MSTTVKSFKVIIGKAESEGFNIKINEVVYRMDNFSISHQLLSPATLNFSLTQTDQEENAAGATFGLSGWLIGKPITLELITENVEQQSAIAKNDEKTADIKFAGFIMNVGANRTDTSCAISVSAATWEAAVDDYPSCKSWIDTTLKDVIEDQTICNDPELGAKRQMSVDPEYTDVIHYSVQFNETRLQFMQRMARRFGEWMYNDGEKLIFGKLPDFPPVQLDYRQKDIVSLSSSVTPINPYANFIAQNNFGELYPSAVEFRKRYIDKFGEPKLSTLQQKVDEASKGLYPDATLQEIVTGGFDDTNQSKDTTHAVSTNFQRTRLSHLVNYYGSTYCSKLKIGVRLQIKDDIQSEDGSGSSQVNHEDILITGVTHNFSADESYSNSFSGIPGVCMYPPYPLGEVIPHASPMAARILDNRDPENMGRVRVEFSFQNIQRQHHSDVRDSNYSTYEEAAEKIQHVNILSPWIPVLQPYDFTKVIPELFQVVMVGFEHGNAEKPFVMGTLWQATLPPYQEWVEEQNENNEVKAFRTKNGHTVEFHDCGPENQGGGFIHLYDTKKKYDMLLSTDGALVRLRSAGDIQLVAKKDIVLKAGGQIGIASNNATTIDAEDFDISAQKICHLAATTFESDTKYLQTMVSQNAVYEYNVARTTVKDSYNIAAKNIEQSITEKMEITSQNYIQAKAEKGDVTLKAKIAEVNGSEKTTITSNSETEISGGNKVTIKAASLATENVTNAKIEATQVEIKGTVQTTVSASTLKLN